MTPEIRNAIVIARANDYFNIMRTTLFGYIAVAAIIEFGPGGYSAPLTVLVITLAAYGVLAGNTALDDIDKLRNDMDDDMAATSYGQGIKARNIPGLKLTSTVLLWLVGIAELYAILF